MSLQPPLPPRADRSRAGAHAPALLALAVSIALIGAYLLAGGASYEPMAVADPCVQRPISTLDARGPLEAIALSALDGAACELQVSREELALALADEESTQAFTAAHGIDEQRLDDAVRAGLERAVDDAAGTGQIDGLEETVLRTTAENAPVGPLLDALRALPGDASPQDVLNALSDLAGGVGELQDRLDQLRDLLP
jgi:hypothetical protein